jgi:hypothetical protein
VKRAFPAPIEFKKPIPQDALQPVLPKLIESGPSHAQHLAGLLLADSMTVEGLKDLFHETL